MLTRRSEGHVLVLTCNVPVSNDLCSIYVKLDVTQQYRRSVEWDNAVGLSRRWMYLVPLEQTAMLSAQI